MTPALRIAPRALGETTIVLRKLGRLVAPGRREHTLASLRTAFVDLPELVGRFARVFPATRPLTDCLSSHIVPTLEQEVPDGSLSTGRPVWQDFVHAMVGLSSASQNFDGNGHSLRYQFGIGDHSLSTAEIPGFGPLLANAPSTLRSRPLPPAGGAPAVSDEEACSDQPPTDLETPSGPAGLEPAR
jgi:phospholipid/cholesterol/gamma-HCH transport system substrate-binding protein